MPLQPQDVNLMQDLIPPFEMFISPPPPQNLQYTDYHNRHLDRMTCFRNAVQANNLKRQFRCLFSFRQFLRNIFAPNQADALRAALEAASECQAPIAPRFDGLVALHGIQTARASEILHCYCPDQCAFLSKQTRKVLDCYPWSKRMADYSRNRPIRGHQYEAFCELVGGAPDSVISVLKTSDKIRPLFGQGHDFEVADMFFRFWSLSPTPAEIWDDAVREAKRRVDDELGIGDCLDEFEA